MEVQKNQYDKSALKYFRLFPRARDNSVFFPWNWNWQKKILSNGKYLVNAYVFMYFCFIYFRVNWISDDFAVADVVVIGVVVGLLMQRTRGVRQYVPDERGGAQQRQLQLHPSGHFQEHVQNRHHVVPVRRPKVPIEVRLVDLWRIHGQWPVHVHPTLLWLAPGRLATNQEACVIMRLRPHFEWCWGRIFFLLRLSFRCAS